MEEIKFESISLCLVTKDATYPLEIWQHIQQFPWGEILILTHSDSPFRKHELFAKAKYETIAYQDDDAIASWNDIVALSKPDIINVTMKEGHLEAHKNNKATQGLGWGAVFPKVLLKSLDKYVSVYGEDEVFKRETERIFTYLNFPQNRLVLPIIDLPSAWAEDRLWRQSNHAEFKQLAEDRCKSL